MLTGRAVTDEFLEWPPDLFALTNLILGQSEAFRFVLSPIEEWPPSRVPNWAAAVEGAGRQWGAWVEDEHESIPKLLTEEWNTFRERAETPLEQLTHGRDWRMCEALLTLHAIADEACAGLGVALDSSNGDACAYRARGRELLAQTGSLARVNPRSVRVLPKVRTPPTGRAAFSRYACVQGPGIDACWHKIPARHPGTGPSSEYATLLLLPWPLRVRESDFRPVDGSVQRLAKEPFGFFEFAPTEGVDLDLLDRVLVAARDEANSIDVVILPESAVDEGDIGAVEGLLDRHGVIALETGVRERSRQPGRFPSNWLHIGISPKLMKGGPAGLDSGAWFHIRQNKHHRWSLDKNQIYQYHLGGVLHPHIQWWEAMEVPRREVHFLEVAELTLVSLVCEDLAQNDDIAALLRSVGPTGVFAVLLDGPQLPSRWAARYASGLADDPGSAVLTLTSYGMVQRSRPQAHDASPVVAMWKDPARGIREIPLETGAHGILLTACMDRTTRRSADGRWPVDNGTHSFDVAVHQVRAAGTGSGTPISRSGSTTRPVLETNELTILTAWAEGVAEALDYAPERVATVLADARSGASWRHALGLPEPPARVSDAVDAMDRIVRAASPTGSAPGSDGVLAAARDDRQEDNEIDSLVRRVLLSVIEQRHTRQPRRAYDGNGPSEAR